MANKGCCFEMKGVHERLGWPTWPAGVALVLGIALLVHRLQMHHRYSICSCRNMLPLARCKCTRVHLSSICCTSIKGEKVTCRVSAGRRKIIVWPQGRV